MKSVQENPKIHEEEDDLIEPATPTGQFFNGASLSVCILAALESEIPINDSQTMSLLENVFIPINSRFSSIMVKDGENGEKHWKKVITKIAVEQLPQSRPLWEIHIFKYPTTNASGTILSDNPSLPLTFPKIRHEKKCFRAFGRVEEYFKPITISTVTFSLDQIKQIKTKLGGAVSKGSGNAQSTALVLLNTREITSYHTVKYMAKPNTKVAWGNNFGFLHVSIPEKVDIENADPLEFVFGAKKMITKKKNSLAVYLNGSLLDLMRRFRGPEVSSGYIHKTLWNTSMTISNLIGQWRKCHWQIILLKFFISCCMEKLRVAVGEEKKSINHKLFNPCLDKSFESYKNTEV
ncbi:hypothetical protein MKX01_008358 [Papaver californicum]|nr:hypothetical protein MKX01_008358 [Papaver californicum]